MPAPLLSLSAVWDETRAYVAREAALLLPVGLATIGVATTLISLAVPHAGDAERAAGSPAMLWALPAAGLTVYGVLALSLLALTPGISVREALARGLGRLGAGLIAFLATGACVLGMLLAAAVLLLVAGLGITRTAQLSLWLALPAQAFFSARLMLALPGVAAGTRPIAALKRSWRLTKPHAAKLTLLVLGAMLISVVILTATAAAGGSAILLIARAAGAPAAGALLVNLLLAFVASALQIVATSYFAFVYRRLAG